MILLIVRRRHAYARQYALVIGVDLDRPKIGVMTGSQKRSNPNWSREPGDSPSFDYTDRG